MSTPEPGNGGKKKMVDAIRQREQREERWQEEGERSLWQNLAMFGALGWLIILPTLGGLLLGTWLDGRFDTGITLTAAGIFIGVCIGGWMAWRRMNGS